MSCIDMSRVAGGEMWNCLVEFLTQKRGELEKQEGGMVSKHKQSVGTHIEDGR